jgi:hypothetical protein
LLDIMFCNHDNVWPKKHLKELIKLTYFVCPSGITLG